MSSYIDIKYLNIISPQLQKFKKKSNNLWNFRCPYCGDSQKNKTKARGFVYQKKNDLFFKCHNCDVGTTVGKLIEYIDSKTHKDYIMERYKTGCDTLTPKPEFKFNAPVFRKKDIFKDLISISKLGSEHPARKIIEKRKLPKESLKDIYLCDSFFKFTNTLIPNKFYNLGGDHPRLMIPFRDNKGEIFAYQGRAFGNETPKYITIKLKESDKIFGLDRVDKSKHFYVCEGPLDSLFIDNCLAVGGSDFDRLEGDFTVIFDNEPRNKEINKQIEKTINKGCSIVLWPEQIKEKDINDMILSGMSKEEVQEIIKNNTFSGAGAKLRFAEWRKINAY